MLERVGLFGLQPDLRILISQKAMKNYFEMHFEGNFSHFRIQTLTGTHPCVTGDILAKGLCNLTCTVSLFTSSITDPRFDSGTPLSHCDLFCGDTVRLRVSVPSNDDKKRMGRASNFVSFKGVPSPFLDFLGGIFTPCLLT